MANLNVNVVDMKDGKVTKIEHNGQHYEKVEVGSAEDVREGDIGLRVKHNLHSVAHVGEYYEIMNPKESLSGLRVNYVDEDGDSSTTRDFDNFEYFRKVVTEEDRKFDKPAQVGDTIRITNRHWASEGDYENGDVLTVLSVGFAGDVIKTDKYEGLILGREFEIIGRAGEEKRTIQVGDTVKLTIKEGASPYYGWGGVVNGEIGKVIAIRSDDEIRVNFPSQMYWKAREGELIVLDGKEEEELQELETGDIVKIVGGTVCDNIPRGHIVFINDEVDMDGDYEIKLIGGDKIDYAKPGALEKVDLSEDDLTFLKAGREIGSAKEGDIVYGERQLALGEFIFGEVVNIADDCGNIGVISFVDRKFRAIKPTKLVATAENRADLS